MMNLSKFTSNKNILNEIVAKLCRVWYIAKNGSVTAFFFVGWLGLRYLVAVLYNLHIYCSWNLLLNDIHFFLRRMLFPTLMPFHCFVMQVLVVANPANTNALILKEFAPSILEKNITCLPRLDHNRALSQIVERLKVYVIDVRNVIIWGNHSSTQYPDVNHAIVTTKNGERPVKELDTDDHWYLKITNMFIFCHFHMFKLFGDIQIFKWLRRSIEISNSDNLEIVRW